jgi:hypothetical protein
MRSDPVHIRYTSDSTRELVTRSSSVSWELANAVLSAPKVPGNSAGAAQGCHSQAAQ